MSESKDSESKDTKSSNNNTKRQYPFSDIIHFTIAIPINYLDYHGNHDEYKKYYGLQLRPEHESMTLKEFIKKDNRLYGVEWGLLQEDTKFELFYHINGDHHSIRMDVTRNKSYSIITHLMNKYGNNKDDIIIEMKLKPEIWYKTEMINTEEVEAARDFVFEEHKERAYQQPKKKQKK